ncbi:MAG: hypothetical protein FE78DRAFT_408821 [Acidomyces sp. 'richmondensis']|nr:MAG: hypothetical protein FE78DRAFT_408821 [Acidomyces sp. 'richmondensis']
MFCCIAVFSVRLFGFVVWLLGPLFGRWGSLWESLGWRVASSFLWSSIGSFECTQYPYRLFSVHYSVEDNILRSYGIGSEYRKGVLVFRKGVLVFIF